MIKYFLNTNQFLQKNTIDDKGKNPPGRFTLIYSSIFFSAESGSKFDWPNILTIYRGKFKEKGTIENRKHTILPYLIFEKSQLWGATIPERLLRPHCSATKAILRRSAPLRPVDSCSTWGSSPSYARGNSFYWFRRPASFPELTIPKARAVPPGRRRVELPRAIQILRDAWDLKCRRTMGCVIGRDATHRRLLLVGLRQAI